MDLFGQVCEVVEVFVAHVPQLGLHAVAEGVGAVRVERLQHGGDLLRDVFAAQGSTPGELRRSHTSTSSSDRLFHLGVGNVDGVDVIDALLLGSSPTVAAVVDVPAKGTPTDDDGGQGVTGGSHLPVHVVPVVVAHAVVWGGLGDGDTDPLALAERGLEALVEVLVPGGAIGVVSAGDLDALAVRPVRAVGVGLLALGEGGHRLLDGGACADLVEEAVLGPLELDEVVDLGGLVEALGGVGVGDEAAVAGAVAGLDRHGHAPGQGPLELVALALNGVAVDGEADEDQLVVGDRVADLGGKALSAQVAGAVVETDHAVDEGGLHLVPEEALALVVTVLEAEDLLRQDDLADDVLAGGALRLVVPVLVVRQAPALFHLGDVAGVDVDDLGR